MYVVLLNKQIKRIYLLRSGASKTYGQEVHRDEKLQVDDKVYVKECVRPFKVICRDDRYIICTKPFNIYHTVIYFIIDLEKQLRGPDDRVFCAGYETEEQCLQRLAELQSGHVSVSLRHSLPLDLEVN